MRYLILILLLASHYSLAVGNDSTRDSKDTAGIYTTGLKSKEAMQAARPQRVASANTASKTGMTFAVKRSLPRNNAYHQSAITTVGCTDSSGFECDAYKGDTDCSVSLPVLCFAPLPGQDDPSNSVLHQWAKGRINTIGPVPGNSFNTLNDVNLACSRLGNPNWRAAQFHENSAGWNWTAFGTAPKNQRFWVHIKNQPANCWQ